MCVYFHSNILCIIDPAAINTSEAAAGQNTFSTNHVGSTSISPRMFARTLNACLFGCLPRRACAWACVCLCIACTERRRWMRHNSHTRARLVGSKSPRTTGSCYQKVFLSKCPWVRQSNPFLVARHKSDKNLCKINKILEYSSAQTVLLSSPKYGIKGTQERAGCGLFYPEYFYYWCSLKI